MIFSNDKINELKASPVFNMSLSSKELFHSNFMNWLATTFPKEFGDFFAEFCGINREVILDEASLKREKENIDFSFSYIGEPSVFIENKVKSMPNKKQLEKYQDKVGGANDYYIILSLYVPDFELGKWKYLSYEKYCDFLQHLANSLNDKLIKHGYYKNLLKDYILLIDALLTIRNRISEIGIYVYGTDSKLTMQLRELRLHDLFFKCHSESIKNKIYNELSIHDRFKRFLDTDKIVLESGMTRATGLFGVKYRINDKHKTYLLIQVQGEQYRMGIESFSNEKKDINYMIEKRDKLIENNLWFEFSNICEHFPNAQIYPNQIKNFNKFGTTFFYRSVKLGGEMQITDLVDTIIKDVERMAEIDDK